ncbi:MAG TPA: energy transducer TonB [Verrucomicrobiae bacterium]
MSRLQKKCFVFSIGMHCLLLVILVGSAAFRDRPDNTDDHILNLIPSTILDQAGAGGGQPAPMVRVAQPQPQAQPQSQPQVQPQPRQQPREVTQPVTQPVVVRHVERPRPQEEEVETHPVAVSDNYIPRPVKTHHHEIHPTFTPTTPTRTHRTTESTEASEEQSAASTARAESRRRSEIQGALGNLASNVRTSGAGRTIVETPGVGGGGDVFAGYWDVVKSRYYHAWIAPENGTDRYSEPEARITVSRDGSILSAELISPSGDTSLDRSVSRALRDVTNLPPFPAGAHDEQRTFRIKFSLDLKEASG